MIQVLMSTYNGEKYLEEQLESLLNQSYNNMKILIRDDGSKDSTLKILEKYEKENMKIKVIYGENVGVIKSFFELIKAADSKCNYFSFCDQDDFWKQNKLKKAIEMIEKKEKTTIAYCSNLKLVDKKLNFIKFKYKKKLIPSFENSIVENIITGCTLIVDKKLMNKLQIMTERIDDKGIKKILMHDWFIYIMASIYGNVIYDENSYIKYRQHENNVVGMATNRFEFIKKRITNIKIYRGRRKKQLELVYDIVKEDLNIKQEKIIQGVLLNKFFNGIKKQVKIERFFTCFLIRIGMY